MTPLYDPVIVAAFQIACGVGGVACAVLAMREGGHRVASGSGPVPPSPLLVYCLGFLVGCMLSQLARYAQQPPTVLGTVAAHSSVVALLVLLWAICHAYARLWSRSRDVAEAPQAAGRHPGA